ncbi:GD12861 [Drosophila simulans]|uniref:RNA helicase n=1 Tax=Drosophila simulans TaxID=7240 RepID=B4QP70_DROSI|nr:GD12861 [Drosophila simulans]
MEREIAHSLAGGEERSSDVAPGQVKTFEELRLYRNLLNGLKRNNFVTPTKIQAAAIPMALANMDLIIQSKSGTGKTLIYVIAVVQSFQPNMNRPHAMIVVPTRELAIQVQDTFVQLCKSFRDFKCSAFIGGTEVAKDRSRMNESRVIIGTPGRLLHLYENRVLDVSKLRLLVLDEADQLYQTKSLQHTVSKLIEAMPKNRQIIACSATYDQDLDERLAKVMDKPMLISNSERATVLLGIRQFVYELPQQNNSVEEMRLKLQILGQIFSQLPYEQAIIFASSQMRADSYKNYLTASGVDCHLISGAMEQSERLHVFEGYRNFTMRILVATDLMARGVDSPHANLVINIDPPQDHVTYLHRIGRAGRFGSKGIAITFISSKKESQRFREMSKKIATAWSVLEFPKEPMPNEFNFWDFEKYNFGYYIKEENPLQEMPMENKRILKRIRKYAKKQLMDNATVSILLDKLYKSMLELYYNSPKERKKHVKEAMKEALKSIDNYDSQESSASEEEDDLKNKLSVHVTNQMDIPPMPQAADEMGSGNESDTEDSQDYGEGEEIIADDEDDGSDGEPNSSSGFIESQESVSSGIDTSVYETESTSASGNSSIAFFISDDESDVESLTYSEDGSNVSTAGSSSPRSTVVSSSDEYSDDESVTETNGITLQNAQLLWLQTFKMQYQFIASHVAKNLQNHY